MLIRSRIQKLLIFFFMALGQAHSFVYVLTQPPAPPTLQQKKPSGDLIVCDGGWKVGLTEKPFSTKTREEILTFRSDPFLLSLNPTPPLRFSASLLVFTHSAFSSLPNPPETPPPRG